MGALEGGLQDGRAGTEFLFQAFEKYWQRDVYGLFSGREISGGIVEQAPKSWISDLEACSLLLHLLPQNHPRSAASAPVNAVEGGLYGHAVEAITGVAVWKDEILRTGGDGNSQTVTF